MDETPKNVAREALIGRERIRGAARVIAEGTEAGAVTAEQIAQVAADVEIFRRNQKISRKAIATAVGYSHSVVTEFLAGNYAGNKANVAIDLESWLVSAEARLAAPQTASFVWTNVAIELKALANYALDKKAISLAYGPDSSGIGKTTALRAIHQELGPRRSTLCVIDKVDASPSGLLVKICQAMHIADNGSNRNRFKRIVDRIRGRSHLLIVDQIHNLRGAQDDKPLYILADLADATDTAILLIGTADIVAYLERHTKNDESLAQIRRRVFPVVDLMEGVRGADGGGEPLVTVDQVREMFARNKLKLTAAAARFLASIANTPDSGSLGLAVRLVEYATMICEMKRFPAIDLPQLKEAMRRGTTTARAENLLNRMRAEQAPQRAAMVG